MEKRFFYSSLTNDFLSDVGTEYDTENNETGSSVEPEEPSMASII